MGTLMTISWIAFLAWRFTNQYNLPKVVQEWALLGALSLVFGIGFVIACRFAFRKPEVTAEPSRVAGEVKVALHP